MKTFPGLDGTELLRVISPWVLTKCNTIRVNFMKEEFEPDYQGDAMDKDPLQIWLCLVETWQQTHPPVQIHQELIIPMRDADVLWS